MTATHAAPAAFLAEVAEELRDELRLWLPRESDPDCPASLRGALDLAALGGGKRLRPALAIAAWEAVADSGEGRPVAVRAAAALECVHAYSLVHDDLPAMDNATVRHGLPTVHRRHGEATAILAGDALLALAFEMVAEAGWADPTRGLRAVSALAAAAGWRGLVGGQQADLESGLGAPLSPEDLRRLHERKTGALFRASVELGGLAGHATEPQLAALDGFARAFGLAFQIVDDILDVVGDTQATGKTLGVDRARGRRTYVDLYGLDGARRRAADAADEASSALAALGGRARRLQDIARWMTDRDR